MKYASPLVSAELLKRYKRFLADVRLPDGHEIAIHCPNTGSMKNCAEPGWQIWYSTSDNPNRKYAHTWELARTHRGDYIGINSGKANELIAEGISEDRIAALSGYSSVRREVRYGEEKSRIDLLLTAEGRPDCYVEVKSVTLLEQPVSRGVGFFPDAVSERGTRHLRELERVFASGRRAVLCFCVQHSGIREVRPAAHIDPAYAQALASAVDAGVEVIAHKVRMSPRSLTIGRSLPVIIGS
ncbi:MAG: DNA/RNA nuclease SfsA [Gammaproteobacteria bacterium]|nr:DNA/RNA nuclease SfsA [Gammaproteobacteria bacterium]RPG23080.1 MAG: DNA/RNA nuclease SfsA [Gammaproteobacteria bacterium TMED50]